KARPIHATNVPCSDATVVLGKPWGCMSLLATHSTRAGVWNAAPWLNPLPRGSCSRLHDDQRHESAAQLRVGAAGAAFRRRSEGWLPAASTHDGSRLLSGPGPLVPVLFAAESLRASVPRSIPRMRAAWLWLPCTLSRVSKM